MWLLNTTTLKLKLCTDDRNLNYAILSHRWAHDEVSFADVENERSAKKSAGWKKVLGACTLARDEGHRYIWIDTCCIDRTSSSELSEAINSMYRWYLNAQVCYVYLQDVIGDDKDMRASEWFTRGWTLQELIAPQSSIFFNRYWNMLGTRQELALSLAVITGVPIRLLLGQSTPAVYSIAQRMAWAARRRTTRAEDMAYSLMGLFGVNMPMLYGEGGERAFIRLQEEIIKDSSDQTIFAWRLRDDTTYRGLLATSPAEFTDCHEVVPIIRTEDVPFRGTNVGLQLSLRARHCALGIFLVELLASEKNWPICIFLGWPNIPAPVNRHGRLRHAGTDRQLLSPDTQNEKSKTWELKEFAIPKDPFPGVTAQPSPIKLRIESASMNVAEGPRLSIDAGIYILARPSTWSPETKTLTLMPELVDKCIFGLGLPNRYGNLYLFLKIGVTLEYNPWVWLLPEHFEHTKGKDIVARRGIFSLVAEACGHYRTLDSPEVSDTFVDPSVNLEPRPHVNAQDFFRFPTQDDKEHGVFVSGDRTHGLKAGSRGLQVRLSRDSDDSSVWVLKVFYDYQPSTMVGKLWKLSESDEKPKSSILQWRKGKK